MNAISFVISFTTYSYFGDSNVRNPYYYELATHVQNVAKYTSSVHFFFWLVLDHIINLTRFRTLATDNIRSVWFIVCDLNGPPTRGLSHWTQTIFVFYGRNR